MKNIEAKDRFYSRKWGVFNHFVYGLQNNPNVKHSYGKETSWEELINEFDTESLAKTLYEIGAGYLVFTVNQATKYMIAPNETFDKIAGTKPGEACSTRDLVEDLYKSLSKYDIDLFLYFDGDGPWQNIEEGKRFGFIEPRFAGVTRPFVEKWASVLEEYAVRYGDKVKGWWLDSCYKEYFHFTDELLDLYYSACKKGNSNCLVALNNGVDENGISVGYEKEDFTCGERNDFEFIPTQRFYGNAQAHILAPLGISSVGRPHWGCFGTAYTKEYLADYVKNVNEAGGVVSIDIGIYRDGKYDEEQKEVLKYVGKKVNDNK